MKNKTLWIDHQHAYIFEFDANKIIEKEFLKKLDTEVTDSARIFTHEKEHQKQFYHLLAIELGEPDQLLILGPGVAKDEFRHHCELHHHEKLAKKVIASIPMKSHPRKSQILKVSQEYFGDMPTHELPS